MLGAIIGDIVGSRYEFNNHRSKDFDFFAMGCRMTDDSIMSLAIAQALLLSHKDPQKLEKQVVASMQEIGKRYPRCGFGGGFMRWLRTENPQPYGSYGNGAAMRVSACAFAAESWDEAKRLSDIVTGVTHNHPEGLKGAEATVRAIWLARQGKSLQEISQDLQENYYKIDFTLEAIRPTYQFNESCQGTVPQALEAFFESVSFEDAIRNAISIGGDSDTIGAIVGGMAQAHFGVPEELRQQAMAYFAPDLLEIFQQFEAAYPPVR